MSVFRFKQFEISQHHAAAKVGTDGVLLGAWTPLNGEIKTILDMGSGTGVIALMLAQRVQHAKVIGVEIDEVAYKECLYNFRNSPWNNRLICLNMDILSFTKKQKYDLIVTNPPFYTETTFAPDDRRNIARNTAHLDFESLLKKVKELLAPKGIFSIIVPFKEEKIILNLLKDLELFPFKITRVKGHATAPLKRSLMAFTTNDIKFTPEELVIEELRHQYTPEYIELTREFYLKF